MNIEQWLYRGGRPHTLAKILNRGWAILHALGIFPDRFVTLEVVGRKSGKVINFPLMMAKVNGERYLVSMLGEEINWVRNVKAANGKARLIHGTSEQVRLQEVEPSQRAPILKAYLQIAPGARPHIPVSKDAPLSEFEKIASEYPVFRCELMNKDISRGKFPAAFFFLVFLLSIPIWIVTAMRPVQLLPGLPLSALSVVTPALAACFLTYKYHKFAGVLQLLKRSFDLNRVKNKGGYFAVLLITPIIALFAFGIMRTAGVALPNPAPLTAAIIPLFLFFFVGALGEEIGWSGYITEPLVRRGGTTHAGLVLGLIWAVWHFIPLMQAHRSIEWIAWWSLSTVALRVMMVWLYIRFGKSICAVAVFHAASNLCWQLFPINGSYYDPQVFGLLTLGAAAAILLVDWFMTKSDAPAAFAK